MLHYTYQVTELAEANAEEDECFMAQMATLLQNLRQLWMQRGNRALPARRSEVAIRSPQVASPVVDIAPDDPIVNYFLSAPGVVEVDKLQLDSPTLRALKDAGVKLAIPLVSQGELVGLLNLSPRRSEQDYSTDDRGLLNTLAAQASPAVRVAQMVREQQIVVLERERMEQELRVARLIQQTLLPRDLPALSGWHFSAYYMAAREVGGDFYDFLYFDDGQLGLVIGDVTDKGVPAALVMATVRSMIRSAAVGEVSPGKVLERTNDLVTLQRLSGTQGLSVIATATPLEEIMQEDSWRTLAELSIPSVPDNERMAMEQVAKAIEDLHLPPRRLERLKTAIAEATMNAIEHGNKYQADVPVLIQVRASKNDLVVRIRDQGGNTPIPSPETPDIEAKLSELQTPRGWGLFLIKNLVDDMLITSDDTHHMIELIMHLGGASDGDETF